MGQGQREHCGTLGMELRGGRTLGDAPPDPEPSEELGQDGCPPTLALGGLHPRRPPCGRAVGPPALSFPTPGPVPSGGRVESGPRWGMRRGQGEALGLAPSGARSGN